MVCCSNNYYETAEEERCPDCGLFCSYRGGGESDSYKQLRERLVYEEAEREREVEMKFILES